MKSLLARVLGVREDEVDDVVKHDRRGAERILSRRGFLGAAAAVAAEVALPAPMKPSGLIQLATQEQVITYSFPAAVAPPEHWNKITTGAGMILLAGAVMAFAYGALKSPGLE